MAEGARTKESWCLEEMEKVRVGFLDSSAKDGLGAGPQAGPGAGQDLQTSFLIRLRFGSSQADLIQPTGLMGPSQPAAPR